MGMYPYTIRLAEPSDAPIIALQRCLMFLDMGSIAAHEIAPLQASSEQFLAKLLAEGRYAGWIAERGEGLAQEVVAGAGVYLREVAPMPGRPRVGRWGHIANLYVLPTDRRRGVARLMMNTVLDWCRIQPLDRVTLTPAPDGVHLYESLGFVTTADTMTLPGN